ncbi:phosphonate ABC transporter, permease protein PhnE [Bacillus circulans]|uniref:phosphonate ABC transporter, permease protein PhnE n=1 Tax=Niallia circulans TaxID=1397 RepID=UPI00148F696A|nr:phosphonate ABC transporter, permease protein PhnE [Niallia circulans]NRG29175.1 phosphonate ABC transporter, permease protein PhnE [Niallia circulans]QJX61702.1 phosphonate ABC transporter, permease protein PhnE [Niallia circulans]
MNEKAIKQPLLNRPTPPAKNKLILTILLLLVLLWWSAYKTDASLTELIQGFPNIFDVLLQMVPPDWKYSQKIMEPLLVTIRMAVIGTTFGAIIAIPLAIFCASNIGRSAFIFYPFRMILNLIRTIPDLLLASIFVAIFGIGSLPGIIALIIFSIGLIAKLLYEAIESIDSCPLEGMTAVGANKIQWIFFGIVPQVTASFTSYVLYTFEVNVRAAAILGLVGAGGIGEYYDRTLNFLQYDRASSIIILTLLVVLIIDYCSTKLREKLL